MTTFFRFFLCMAATCPTLLLCADWAPAASRPRLDLTGQWDFYPDVGDAALHTVTAEPGKNLVPGVWQAQGYGKPGGSIPSSVSDGGDPLRWTDIESPHAQPEKWRAFTPKPRLLHEYGNYCCSLPDFSLIPRLNGVIRPLTYERAQAYVNVNNLQAVYPRLYRSSLAMRADAQKSYLEAARVNDNSGYSFWLGIDFPESPEGCWDEGILNQLWEPKPGLTDGLPDVTAPTVLLTSAGIESRSFYGDEPPTVGCR